MGTEVLVRMSDATGAELEVKDLGLARAFLKDYTDAIGRPAMSMTLESTQVPRIGAVWPGQGGVYAGLCRGFDGKPDHHLFVAAAEQKIKVLEEWRRLALNSAGFAGLKTAELLRARKAIEDLIALKDYKDAHGKDDYYQTAQPLAWINAREAMKS
jgi:hypothetical protein